MSKIEKITNLLLTTGGILAGGSMIFKLCTYTVDAGNILNLGERAIIFDRAFGGVKNTVYGEGMHFVIPFI